METTMTKPKLTPKDFIIQFGLLISLYLSAVSFLTFIFQAINSAYPDRQAYDFDPYSSAMRLSISMLIVFFPIFVALVWSTHKSLAASPEKRELSLRKWLLYVSLFITALTLAIDLVTVVNTFLGGEITARFILKAISIFVVAAVIFTSNILDVRGTYFAKPKLFKWVTISSVVVVLISFVIGFIVIGSPTHQRMLKDDATRVNDLESIQWRIVNSYQSTGVLPATIEELSDPLSSYMVTTDPKTGLPYEYKILDAKKLSFQLCATFELPTPKSANPTVKAYPGDAMGESWDHRDAGTACFTRTIDPLKYPPYDNVKDRNMQ